MTFERDAFEVAKRWHAADPRGVAEPKAEDFTTTNPQEVGPVEAALRRMEEAARVKFPRTN